MKKDSLKTFALLLKSIQSLTKHLPISQTGAHSMWLEENILKSTLNFNNDVISIALEVYLSLNQVDLSAYALLSKELRFLFGEADSKISVPTITVTFNIDIKSSSRALSTLLTTLGPIIQELECAISSIKTIRI